MRLRALTIFLAIPCALAAQASKGRAESYRSGIVDAAGRFVITTSDGRVIVVPREGAQTAFADPAVSSEHGAAGALAEFANSGTTYDIALELVVYADGALRRFNGTSQPIYRWHFTADGKRVAFAQGPLHFSCSTHYELRDVRSKRLIDSADIAEPCGQDLHPKPVAIPKWVTELNNGKQ